VLPRFNLLLEAFKAANIFIFPKGEIEQYYSQTSINYLNITDKEKNTSFHKEREYLLSCEDISEIETNYKELITILKTSVPKVEINLNKHLKFQIIEWIQTVQRAVSKGDIKDLDGLKINAKINYKLFSQLFEAKELNINNDKKFTCKIEVNSSLIASSPVVLFDEKTIPHTFEFKK